MSSAPRIAVVDYGAGNLRSVAKALARSGLVPNVTSDPADVRRADGVVLPGAGAFAAAMANLAERKLADAVRDSIRAGRAYLGLCLGLQLLFDEGDEHAVTPGLALLRGRVTQFPERDASGTRLRVPHIGWNEVRFRGDHPMLAKLGPRELFYFVHSFRAQPADASVVVGSVDYGGEFAAAVAQGNVFAVQFHPEKSQAAGKRLLDAYAGWIAQCR
jgi:glutamine amidotransferase